MEKEIKETVSALLDAIGRQETPRIVATMERLDLLLATGRTVLHPQLVHFLQNRSYSKALLFLGGNTDIPAGACGGGRRT